MEAKTMRAASWVGWALMTLAGLWAWSQVPEGTPVAMHFNARGEPDGWGPAALAFLVLPLAVLLSLGLQWLLPRIEPQRANLEDSQRAVATVFLGVTLMMGGMQAYLIALTLGWALPQPHFILGLLGLLLMVVGNVMGKIRPNYMVGIRTPWTLANTEVWDQTHRFGGKAFVLAGLAMLLLAVLPVSPDWTLPAILLLTLGAAGAAILKSYVLWRQQQRGS